jgi:hypothetical protein
MIWPSIVRAGKVLLLVGLVASFSLSWIHWPGAARVASVALLAFLGLIGSNFLYDLGVPNAMARRFAPVIGGLAYLAAVTWLEVRPAIAVSGILTVLILLFRSGFRSRLRGVRGAHPAQQWAEVTYPLVGTLSLYFGWFLQGDRWLAFLPIAFMAWGDTMAGLARNTLSPNNAPSLLTMGAMFSVCLIAAGIFFRPFWIGAAGAVAATLAERYRPGFSRVLGDNPNIVAASLIVLVALSHIA